MTADYKLELSDLVGIDEQLAQLEDCIKRKIPVMLVGPPGVGKTSGTYAVSNKLKFQVIEINASDVRDKESLQKILRKVQMGSINPLVYLFDEIDGTDKNGVKSLTDIIQRTKYPLVFTTNDQYKVPEDITKRCEIIYYNKIDLSDVVTCVKERAKKDGIKNPDFTLVTGDMRSSIIATANKSATYKPINDFDRIKKFLQKGEIIGKIDQNTKIWIMDNIPKFNSGMFMYENYQLLALADRTHCNDILENMRKSKSYANISYPYLYKKIKAKKSQKENSINVD